MMIDQFTSYSTKLERLSNDELHRSAEKLVLAENRTIAKLIAHLAEMSKKRLERRRKKQRARTAISRSNEVAKKDEPAESRYVAAEVLERVHERDSYQCIYRGCDGRRCTARAGLHIDHSDPFGIFHGNEETLPYGGESSCRNGLGPIFSRRRSGAKLP